MRRARVPPREEKTTTTDTRTTCPSNAVGELPFIHLHPSSLTNNNNNNNNNDDKKHPHNFRVRYATIFYQFIRNLSSQTRIHPKILRSWFGIFLLVLLIITIISTTKNSPAIHPSYYVTTTTTTDTIDFQQEEFAIFYHIFIPKNDVKAQTNAVRIVREQLQQIQTSYAVVHSNLEQQQRIKLYYNTVGASNIITPDYMDSLCTNNNNNNNNNKNKNKLECIHLQHYDEEGIMEEPTLTKVYDYCRHPTTESNKDNNNNNNNNNRRVIYMHNKGSYHVHKLNEHWRRLMTYAVTSQECLHPPPNNASSCNLCGLYFVAERGMFMAGNIWTAHCNYLSKLVTPHVYRNRSTAVIKDSLLLHLQMKFDMDLYAFEDFNFGIDRYSDENWSASHPDVVPCDFTAGKKHNFRFLGGRGFYRWIAGISDPFQTKRTLEWTMYPSLPLALPLTMTEEGIAGWFFNPSERIREYFLLGGNILKWQTIYNKVPEPSSWIWTFFPDGDLWRNAVHQYGKDAVNKLTTEHQGNALPWWGLLQNIALILSEVKFVVSGLFYLD